MPQHSPTCKRISIHLPYLPLSPGGPLKNCTTTNCWGLSLPAGTWHFVASRAWSTRWFAVDPQGTNRPGVQFWVIWGVQGLDTSSAQVKQFRNITQQITGLNIKDSWPTGLLELLTETVWAKFVWESQITSATAIKLLEHGLVNWLYCLAR